MHCIVCRAWGGSTDDDNRTARATGHRPNRRSPRRDRMAIPVIGRAANALILGLDLAAPILWEAEVSNVLWMAARTGLIDKPMALRRLGMAARLGIRSVP